MAFVTQSGVDVLVEVLRDSPPVQIQVVARGAPVTDPDALVRLRDELGAEVGVVMGSHAQHFHPKLWLFRGFGSLAVLSGSGNMTRGGLIDNAEQFEIARGDAPSAWAEAQEQRFLDLTAHQFALQEVYDGSAWREWIGQMRRRRQVQAELDALDRRLASRDVVQRRDADLLVLSDDLDELYERTRAAKLRRRDGHLYVPSRFKQGIDRARAAGNPVPTVANICRRRSEGFDVILAADRPDLTVESLVVDETKRYHDLFKEETRRASAERLELFPTWQRGWRPGQPLPDRPAER